MNKVIIGLDISLRSTGISVVDLDGKLIECRVIQNQKDMFKDNLDCILYNTEKILDVIDKYYYRSKVYMISCVIVEYQSMSSKNKFISDILANNMHPKLMIRKKFPEIEIIDYSPAEWRKVYLKETGKKRKELKEIEYGNHKDWLKMVVWDRQPEQVKNKIKRTIKKLEKILKSNPHYDISDSYGLCRKYLESK